jgi:septal ring factor EnvC (AmiA/AmiB activator)
VKYQLQLIILVSALALMAGAFAYGYHKGSVAEIQKIADKTAETQEELFDLADTVRLQADKLRQLQREKEDLVNALEQEALVAEGSESSGVATTGGLQRLERRWGPSPRSAD